MTIAIVTGSRADHGPLTPVQKALGGVWVHVNPSPSKNHQDSVLGCSAAMLAASTQYAFVKPDLVVVLGDRFEILGAAIAAFLLNIPIAHLSGGDVTEGSQDNAMRHAISKLAHIHFTTNEAAAHNLVHNLGEENWRVFNVGCPGIDNLEATQLYSLEETTKRIGGRGRYFLVAYQPATLALNPLHEAKQLVNALIQLKTNCVFTLVNADAGGREIESLFHDTCVKQKWSMLDMDSRLYLSAMRHCILMVGNSSSGFYEAPSFRKPFINIGDRQRGRIAASSIISAKADEESIVQAITKGLALDCSTTTNPYGDGRSAERIRSVLEKLLVDRQTLLTKKLASGLDWLEMVHGMQEMLQHTASRTLH